MKTSSSKLHELIVLLALAGCSSIESTGGRDAAVVIDAPRRDAGIDAERMPFTTTGTTPAGSLDDVRFIEIDFLSAFCLPGYYVGLYTTNDLYAEAAATFYIPITSEVTQPPIGTIAASAWPGDDYDQRTEDVSFAIVQLDIPPTSPLRIAGRMTIGTDGWNVDFMIDAQVTAGSCF